MTRVISSLDELRSSLGETIGPSNPVIVDQARIDAFADATGDRQWIHINAERAANGPYGATIAHGFLTLSLIPVLSAELVVFSFGSARVNYGVNRVRFPAPVLVDSRIRASMTFTDIAEGPAGVTVNATYVLDAGAPKPVCVAETLLLVTR